MPLYQQWGDVIGILAHVSAHFGPEITDGGGMYHPAKKVGVYVSEMAAGCLK